MGFKSFDQTTRPNIERTLLEQSKFIKGKDNTIGVRTESPNDLVNDPTLYDLIDDKRVMRTSPLNNTAILSTIIGKLTEGINYTGVRSTYPVSTSVNLLEFLSGEHVEFRLEIVYSGISWETVRVPRDLETGDGQTIETGDGRIITEG